MSILYAEIVSVKSAAKWEICMQIKSTNSIFIVKIDAICELARRFLFSIHV